RKSTCEIGLTAWREELEQRSQVEVAELRAPAPDLGTLRGERQVVELDLASEQLTADVEGALHLVAFPLAPIERARDGLAAAGGPSRVDGFTLGHESNRKVRRRQRVVAQA